MPNLQENTELSSEQFASVLMQTLLLTGKVTASVQDLILESEEDLSRDDLEHEEVMQNVQELSENASATEQIFMTIRNKLLSGKMLSEADFYLQRIVQVVPWVVEDYIGLGELTEYERYCLMYYQDDESNGVIGTRLHEKLLHRNGGRMIALFRLPPSKVRIAALSLEQIRFWQKYFPMEFAEFS